MKAFILAAGLGTRLRPLTEHTPKVLVPVAGVPMLERILAGLFRAGLREIGLNTHHLPEAVTAHMERLRRRFPALALAAFHEPTLLGTGGALVNAAEFWDDAPLLVWNGDVIADVHPAALEDALRQASGGEGGNVLAVLAVQERAESSHLLVDEAGRIVGIDAAARGGRRLVARPAGEPRALAFTGISLLAPAVRGRIARPGAFDLIDALLEVIAQGGRVLAQDIGAAFWGTHGSPREREALERRLAARPEWLARFTPPE